MGGLHISEIFGPTIQGEGTLIGRPTVFVRTGGCDYRCSWCDTLYAVLPEFRATWHAMSPEAVLEEVERRTDGRPILVTLSGGNPALQDLAALIHMGRRRGHRFALETQGSIVRKWFALLDWLILSPKPPSSGETPDADALAACVGAAGRDTRTLLKIVVFDEVDYGFARATARCHPSLPVVLQVGNHIPPPASGPLPAPDEAALRARFRWLVDRVGRDGWYEARVLPQLHIWAWGNERGA